MKKIEKLEQARKEQANLKEWGINHTFFWAYEWTKETTNEHLNLPDVIWEKDVPEIIENCKQYEIKEFTISSTFCGLLDVLAEFEKNNCKVGELTKISTSLLDINGEIEKRNAIKIIIK